MTMAQQSLPIEGDDSSQGPRPRGTHQPAVRAGSVGGKRRRACSAWQSLYRLRRPMNSEVRRSAESRRGVEVLEDGVGIGAEIGPERIFLDGPGRCFRNYGPRTAVGSVGQGLLTRQASIQPAACSPRWGLMSGQSLLPIQCC